MVKGWVEKMDNKLAINCSILTTMWALKIAKREFFYIRDFPYYSISWPVYQQEQQLLFKEPQPHVPRAPQEPQQLICDW